MAIVDDGACLTIAVALDGGAAARALQIGHSKAETIPPRRGPVPISTQVHSCHEGVNQLWSFANGMLRSKKAGEDGVAYCASAGAAPHRQQGRLLSTGGQHGPTPPCAGLESPSKCPYNLFRSSGDVTNSFERVHHNVHSLLPFLGDPPLSRPGETLAKTAIPCASSNFACYNSADLSHGSASQNAGSLSGAWAYADGMELGRMSGPHSAAEDATIFGWYVITSSPLDLGHNISDDATNERVWPIVSNLGKTPKISHESCNYMSFLHLATH